MPVRIEISWERAKELLAMQGISVYGINTEEDMNDYMGNGRNCFSTSIFCLTGPEWTELEAAGFEDKYDGDIVLLVEKETYPGKYLVGEF